ncbi:hypothetical protein DL96DRAFT_1585287 [Flagelloscypha sp. PMI_526]|nr:hypothetical protein DL96DRAFT_1585287 [Flagelloscypha sp. PMI_526]
MSGQHFPNEIVAPILQYSSWTLSKAQQLQLMLLSSTAFESISWVFYHDIIIRDSNDGSILVHLVEAMNRLGSKYFAYRVRALWIDIAPSSAQVESNDVPDHFFGVEWANVADSFEAVFSTCRNIRHLRLNAQTHLDTLLQSALALRKLQSLCLSRSFHSIQFSDSTLWPSLISDYPTPALSSITHLTIEYLEDDSNEIGDPVYISLFKNVTHLCIHITASADPYSSLPNYASYSLPSLSIIVFLNHSPLEEWSQLQSFWCKHPSAWANRFRCARAVPNEPPFGSIDEWRSVVLSSRFPTLAEYSVWGRQKYPPRKVPRRIRRAQRARPVLTQ